MSGLGLIVPFYPTTGAWGRQPVPVETMLRMYLLQVWFSLSDEGTEDAIYDSYAFRTFLGLDFTTAQVPDATTLLHFRHLIEAHDLDESSWTPKPASSSPTVIMRGGSVIDADDHQSSGPRRKTLPGRGPANAPDGQGEPVVLRDEGTPASTPEPDTCAHRHGDGRECWRHHAGGEPDAPGRRGRVRRFRVPGRAQATRDHR
ncbi:MAG: transposase [Tessaracoccus sp.]